MQLPPLLRRFDILVTKNRAPSDRVQIPADATADFYGQGATVKPGEAIYVYNFEPAEAPVWHFGAIEIGDYVFVGGDTSKRLHVDDKFASSLLLSNPDVPPVIIANSARLFREAPRPLVYEDPTGQESTGSSTLIAQQGRLKGYMRDWRFDIIVAIPGLPRRLYLDGVGSFVMRT